MHQYSRGNPSLRSETPALIALISAKFCRWQRRGLNDLAAGSVDETSDSGDGCQWLDKTSTGTRVSQALGPTQNGCLKYPSAAAQVATYGANLIMVSVGQQLMLGLALGWLIMSAIWASSASAKSNQ